MNPIRLLRLWRERWGMADDHVPSADYVMLGNTSWERRLTQAPLWSMAGMPVLIGVLALLVLLPAALVVYPPPAQSMIGLMMLALAFYVRRHLGLLPFIMMAGLVVLALCRYLSWRLQYAIPGGELRLPGVLLWLAELYLAVTAGLWMLTRIWPMLRTQDGMHDAPYHWPYVDLVLTGAADDPAAVRRAIALVEAQQWPADRLTVHVDAPYREAVDAVLRQHGIGWVEQPQTPQPSRAVLPDGNGEYVVLADIEQATSLLADPSLLQNWIAWMRRDPSLALLYSPGHGLASPTRADALRLLAPAGKDEIAIVRRTAWPRKTPPTHLPMAAQLERAGMRTAMVGHPAAEELADPHDVHGRWYRIDEASHGKSVRSRYRLHRALQAMRTGVRYAWAAVAGAILAMPLLGVHLVDAPFEWFVAYLFPCLALLFLVWQRTLTPKRVSPWLEAREWTLAATMPLAFAAATLSGWRRRLHRQFPAVAATPAPAWRRIWWIALAIALPAALWRLLGADDPARPWLAAVVLGLLYAIALELSRWAVNREAALLRAMHDAQSRMPGLLRTPDRHLLPCVTQNFPADPLILRFEDDLASGPARGYALALNAQGRDHRFVGSLKPFGERAARFRIAPESLRTYAEFAREQVARITASEYWLPGRRLDRWFLSLIGRGMPGQPRAEQTP